MAAKQAKNTRPDPERKPPRRIRYRLRFHDVDGVLVTHGPAKMGDFRIGPAGNRIRNVVRLEFPAPDRTTKIRVLRIKTISQRRKFVRDAQGREQEVDDGHPVSDRRNIEDPMRLTRFTPAGAIDVTIGQPVVFEPGELVVWRAAGE